LRAVWCCGNFSFSWLLERRNEAQVFCSKCGARLTEGTAFCSVCGTPVSGPPLAASAPPTYASPAIVPAGVAPAYLVAPAAVTLPSPYAGFLLRVVAHLIDGIVLGVIFLALFLIGLAFVGIGSMETMVRGMHNGDGEPPVALVLMLIFVFFLSIVASWIYSAYLESSSNQGTLGKMALGLIVTDLQGRRISFGHATGRFFAKIITGLIPLGIGYMMAGFTEKKQALHDMIAATLVLRKN
jgi:uncharacterized RDD family membrane protein YckC